jgi:hypothetical protein
MQRRASAFKGYTIEAIDGNVGSISDILFEGDNWKLRWFVINTGSWLLGRKVLIHPSSLQQPDVRRRAFPVSLTRFQVEASPGIRSDESVSLQMDHALNDYYGYNPTWSGGFYGGDGYGTSAGSMSRDNVWQNREPSPSGDPNLRSLDEVTGYHVHALDGDIGHLEDFLVDDETWKIDYAVINTKNWGFGKHVLVAPSEIKEIDWAGQYIRLELTRYNIKCSPSWKEPDWSDLPAP